MSAASELSPTPGHRAVRMLANPWLIFAVIGVGSFLGPLSGSITNVALPTIGKHFGADVQSVKWIVLSYLTVNTFLLPMAGKWGQRFGASRLYTMGFALYALGSAACGASAAFTFDTLVAARVFQACGSALLFATAGALVAKYIPVERRGLAFGLVGSIVAVALVTGPVVGGLICARFDWTWIFWLQVPVAVLGLLSCYLLLPHEPVNHPQPFPALSAITWVLLVSGLSIVGEAFSKGLWDEYLWLTVPATCIALLALLWTERRGPALFDYSMFRIQAFSLSVIGALMLNLIFFMLLLFLPFYLEDYVGIDLEKIGLLLGISPLASFISGPTSGHLSDRIGFRIPIISGMMLTAAGFFTLAGGVVWDRLWLVGLSLALLGLGSGMFGGPNFAAMMGSVANHQRPLASSMGSLTRNVGFMAGASVGSILFGLLLAQYGGRELMLAARSHVLTPASVPETAFTFAFSRLVLVCGTLALLGVISCLRFPNRLEHPVQAAQPTASET